MAVAGRAGLGAAGTMPKVCISLHEMYMYAICIGEMPPFWGRLDANGGQISGFCGHTFHLHIVYLRALLVQNRMLFFRICFVASCEMAAAGRTGPNAARIMPKVHDMWVNSLAALLPPISV